MKNTENTTTPETSADLSREGLDNASCSTCHGWRVIPGDTSKGEDVMNTPCPKCNEPNPFILAAIETYNDMTYQEEYWQFVKKSTMLIGEIMRDEVNAQDECEKFLRAYAPKMLEAHYST